MHTDTSTDTDDEEQQCRLDFGDGGVKGIALIKKGPVAQGRWESNETSYSRLNQSSVDNAGK